MKPGQQLYGVIEFCNDPETLFAKINSGHWDWLGVRRKGGRDTYVLGRPRRGGSGLFASMTSRPAGLDDDRHRVVVHSPHPVHKAPTVSWWATDDEARAEYERLKSALTGGDGSGLFKVSLYVGGRLVDEEFIVRALPNVL